MAGSQTWALAGGQPPFFKQLLQPVAIISEAEVESGVAAFSPGLLALLKGGDDKKLQAGMWPSIASWGAMPLRQKLGSFLQHQLAMVMSPTLDGFCERRVGEGAASSSASALEMPLHGMVQGKRFRQPACMMLDPSKVVTTQHMSFRGQPGTEDPADQSKYVRVELGMDGKQQVWVNCHRLVCLAYRGFAPSAALNQACHTGCKPGGHKGCVQPYHVDWQTHEHNLSQYREQRQG